MHTLEDATAWDPRAVGGEDEALTLEQIYAEQVELEEQWRLEDEALKAAEREWAQDIARTARRYVQTV